MTFHSRLHQKQNANLDCNLSKSSRYNIQTKNMNGFNITVPRAASNKKKNRFLFAVGTALTIMQQ